MSDTAARRLLIPVTVIVLLAYYLFFVWPGLRLYFDNDDMMNLYFAWSKPIMSSYRPLGALFYRTMFALVGFNPLPFRIFCITLGAINMGLCYWFAHIASRSHRIAALAVLLFAFHTRLMEVWYRTAVVYDLLCFTFFYLAACLYMSRRKPGVWRGIGVVLCFIIALEAKEVAVVLPVILLVWNFMQNLTEEEVERRARDAFNNNLPALVEAYRNKFGTEIGTDNAREIVSAEYAESVEARTRWSRATQKPAGALSDYLFEDALRNPDPSKPPVVVFTAGGTGAGKATALAADPELRDAQFICDSNLGSKKSSVQKIEAARAAGNEVHIIFVHRDPVEALTGGVLPRAMTEGRVVDLEAHARMYRDSTENFGWLIRKYSAEPNVCFQAFDNSNGPGGGRIMPVEKAAGIRYSTNELRPKLRAALEKEYAARRISDTVYRATLGPSSPEASGIVSRTDGPDVPAGSDPSPSRGGVLGNSGGVDGGEPEPERSGADDSAEAKPGRLDVSLAVPLLCGLIDIPYLWFKTHGAQALANVVDYQPQYTFTRFAHTWALYLNYLFVLKDQILPWMAIAIAAALLLASLRSRKLLFAWTLLFVPVLPVAFLEYRGAFVLYTSYPGWTLYIATALVALQDLVKTHRTALACLVFAIVGWRFGKLNLHDQRADPRTWLHQSPQQVQQLADALPALAPQLLPGAHVLFVNDAFSTDEWTPYFITKLLYRDDTIVPDRIKMMATPPKTWDGYEFVFTYEKGQYRRLKP